MSYAEGAIYGTVKYGTAYYGRPLISGSTPLPTFSCTPADAQATDYVTIQVTWSLPTNGATLRLVRNSFSQPADENDGLILAQQGVTATPLFVDNTLSTDSAGQFLYYTVWNEDGSGNWWRAADMQALLPTQWGYGDQLFALLPAYWQDLDTQLGDVIPLAIPAVAAAATEGVTWADLAGMTWTEISEETWGSATPSDE